MDEPHWLVDEMLGRLARYLRFLGYDAEYVRGTSDDEVVRRARAEKRRVVTRDRLLAQRMLDAVLLTQTDIEGQMRELKEAYPPLRNELRFDRCSICNGRLSIPERVPRTGLDELPPDVREGRVPLYSCTLCGHLYWEGSHTQSIRARLAHWLPAEPVTG
jgi:uncharacterized protein with PIN domain